jgi:hypothetical protein
MKADGHIKLSVEAIKQMQKNCQVERKLCNLPIFSIGNFSWNNPEASNRIDFVNAFIAYILNLKAYNFNSFDPRRQLARRVAAVDFDESWTHDAPTGQRYHFMKSSSESEYDAYINGCSFLKEKMDKWVVQCQQKINLLNKLQNDGEEGTFQTRRYGVKYLAEALHALQDSFSPAHTVRSEKITVQIKCYKEAMTKGIDAAEANHPHPIIKIFDYSEQKHGSPVDIDTPHSKGDIHSGSLNTNSGKLAIKATQELITLGLQSVSQNRSSLIGWGAYKAKWLSQNKLPKIKNNKCL